MKKISLLLTIIISIFLSISNFNFLKGKGIPFTYLETEFYDNPTAMKKFKDNESQVALAVAKCIKKHYQ